MRSSLTSPPSSRVPRLSPRSRLGTPDNRGSSVEPRANQLWPSLTHIHIIGRIRGSYLPSRSDWLVGSVDLIRPSLAPPNQTAPRRNLFTSTNRGNFPIPFMFRLCPLLIFFVPFVCCSLTMQFFTRSLSTVAKKPKVRVSPAVSRSSP